MNTITGGGTARLVVTTRGLGCLELVPHLVQVVVVVGDGIWRCKGLSVVN